MGSLFIYSFWDIEKKKNKERKKLKKKKKVGKKKRLRFCLGLKERERGSQKWWYVEVTVAHSLLSFGVETNQRLDGALQCKTQKAAPEKTRNDVTNPLLFGSFLSVGRGLSYQTTWILFSLITRLVSRHPWIEPQLRSFAKTNFHPRLHVTFGSD